jgi:hypothetical protein
MDFITEMTETLARKLVGEMEPLVHLFRRVFAHHLVIIGNEGIK